MNSPRISPLVALVGLWVRLGSIGALTIYLFLDSTTDAFSRIDAVASTALTLLWTLLMGEYLRGGSVLPTDPRRLWLSWLYPWLIAFEGAVWSLYTFTVLLGALPDANPLALLAVVTVWGASVAVNFLIFAVSLRVVGHPEDTTGRAQFTELLNWAAALAAANTVMNVVRLGGTPGPSPADQIAFGLQGVVEVAALLLLRWALKEQEKSRDTQAS
ncbi:hypothetical protein MF271_15770 [Deinococcus sp. KNUC1210]|uniref:hypothetical protein n=1 Tax=Deinococcus sp. KNUC1210 TaxID=2917691 RepID=UPI001EF0D760|nr:hypothetical protein [Deinococcus sp. KNUC1210]ULH15369.1 hypothetical protein MF271_15770 [Deinococcus sp. KNUC1210]